MYTKYFSKSKRQIEVICNVNISARRNFVRGEARSTKGGLVRGVAAWGVPGAEPPDAGKVIKNL